MSASDAVTVTLMGVPVEPLIALQASLDEMAREVQLMDLGESESPLDEATAEVVARSRSSLSPQRGTAHDQAQVARAEGSDTVDLVMPFTPAAVSVLESSVESYREVVGLARDGQMLSPPISRRQWALLVWMRDEITGQVRDGRTPRPWTPPRPG